MVDVKANELPFTSEQMPVNSTGSNYQSRVHLGMRFPPPNKPFSNNNYFPRAHNDIQCQPQHLSYQVPNNVHPSDSLVPPQSSVKLLDRSDHNYMPRRNIHGDYDPTAPAGYKFKSYSRFHKKKYEDPQKMDIASKLSELKLDNKQSPVTRLNQIMAFQRKTVDYELVSIAGYSHSPVFTFCAKSDEVVVHGSGCSKKDAKKNAAIAFLDKMDFNNGNIDITSTTSDLPIPVDKNHAENILESQAEINPVGVLQEMCMARHWQLPDYEFPITEPNETLDPWYTVKCSLRTFETRAEDKTKQAAKKQAARRMYDHIKGLTQEEIDVPCYIEYQTPDKVLLYNNEAINDTEKPANDETSVILKHLEHFYEQLKLSKNPCLNGLKKVNFIEELSMSPFDVLEKMANEEGFRVTYVKFYDHSLPFVLFVAELGILVQLSINHPFLVLASTGTTVEQAQEKAASIALLYIKLMIEK